MLYNVKAALFDLDGVVVFTDKYHYLGWKKLADEKGWDFNEQVNHSCRGVPRMVSLQIILDHNRVDLPQAEKESLANLKNEYYMQLLQTISADDIYPGVLDFIKELKERGVKTAICSSSKNALFVLKKLGIVELFDCVVSGMDVENPKPDPEIFQKAAKQLNIHPFNSMVFEDAENGIEAARRGGFRHIGIGSRDHLPNADEVVKDYSKIDIGCMIEFGRTAMPEADPWKIIQRDMSTPQTGYWESLFSLCNGYIGLRGSYEEDWDMNSEFGHPGMYINGFFETIKFPPAWRMDELKKMDLLLNLFDWRLFRVSIDGQIFSAGCGKVMEQVRELDMQHGVMTRRIVWESPDGKQVQIDVIRLVSMTRLHSAVIRYKVTPLNFSGKVEIQSGIRCKTKTSRLDEGGLEKQSLKQVNRNVWLAHYRTAVSALDLAMGCSHAAGGVPSEKITEFAVPGCEQVDFAFSFDMKQNESAWVDKHVTFFSTLETPGAELENATVRTVEKDAADGIGPMLAEQSAYWLEKWKDTDIVVEGNVSDQQAARFELFQLSQNHTPENLHSISATGITGDNYHGWIFWDTEVFMFPFFIYSDPVAARSLLQYRYDTLDGARYRAKEIQLPGACYGWSTMDGTENNSYFPASTTQYHVNCDIGYALWRYFNVTQDFEFMVNCGAEILFEISRMIAALGKFIPMRDNKFCINYVTGPDEYNYHVNNNCFTNMIAQFHIEFSLAVYDRMQKECPDALAKLTAKLKLADSEIALWRRIVREMYIPFNKELQIHEQDDGYLYRDPVDMEVLPDNYEFKFSYTEINLGRMQVSKQGDVVLINFLLGDRFAPEIKKNNFEFYIQRTRHVSSLSACIHSIMAAETGRNDLVYDLLRQTIYMDVCDLKKNVVNGVHFACAGGSWMVVVNGLAGLRDYNDGLHFNPKLPGQWKAYSFNMKYRGRSIAVRVEAGKAVYTLNSGEPLSIVSAGKTITLAKPGVPVEQTLVGSGAL